MKPYAKALLILVLASLGYAAGLRAPRISAEDPKTVVGGSENPLLLAGAARHQSDTGPTFSESRERLRDLASTSPSHWDTSYFLDGKRSGQDALEIERIFAPATREDLIAFFAEEQDPAKTGGAVIHAAYARLAELSLDEALAIWTDQFQRTKNGAGADGIARAWAKSDPAAAERWVDGLPDPQLKSSALFALLDAVVETRPDLVERRITDIGGRDFRFISFSIHLVSRLARQVPSGKLEHLADRFLSETEDSWEYQNQIVALLEVWGERDGAAMMAWLLAQNPGRFQDHVVPRVLEARAKSNPAAFLREIGPSLAENEGLGPMAGQTWLKWLASDETGEAMKWLESNGDHLKITERSAWHSQTLSAEEANRALSQLAGLADGETKTEAVRAILNNLYRTDPKSALVHARERLPQGHGTDMFVASTLSHLARSGDPTGALEWALGNLDAGQGKNDAVRYIMSAWVDSSPLAAAERASNLSGKLREEAFNGIAYRWAERDPEQLMDYLTKAPDPASISSLARNAFWSLGHNRSGESYLAHAMELPHEAMRIQAIEGLFGGWSRANLESSAQALKALERGPIRDVAVAAFVSNARWADREAALTWSLDITDPKKRREVTMQQSRYWLNADRGAATKWIETSEALPPEWKAELLKAGK